MPTPFYHIYIGEKILNHSSLSPNIQRLLEDQRAAFLLGITAADVQTISGQERPATHFFHLPYRDGTPFPWYTLWQQYPELTSTDGFTADKIAFICGYLCHLQADWLWILEIFIPGFESARWAPFRRRMHLHNVLRAYIDAQVRDELAPDMGITLSEARPQHWLPFVKDCHILAWRDLLVKQFQPGGDWMTVKVFATRQGVSPREFYEFMESESRMEDHIFRHMPRSRMKAFANLLVDANLRLIGRWAQAVL